MGVNDICTEIIGHHQVQKENESNYQNYALHFTNNEVNVTLYILKSLHIIVHIHIHKADQFKKLELEF